MKNSEKTSKGHSSSKDSEKGYEKESLFNFKNHKVEKTSFSHTYIYQRQQKKKKKEKINQLFFEFQQYGKILVVKIHLHSYGTNSS